MEQWEQINGSYAISSEGNVRETTEDGFSVTRGNLVGTGYRMVRIFGNLKYVHRLVAEAFIPNPENKKTVNHKNGNKSDNSVLNLEWNTHKENNVHAINTGLNKLKGQDHPNSELNLKQVLEIYRLKKEGKRLHEIHKIFNINYGTLKCIYHGKNWKYEYEKFFGVTYKPTGSNHGEVCGKSIPKEKVLKIYELKKIGKRIFEIAKELDLKEPTVKQIFHGKNWKHLYKEHF